MKYIKVTHLSGWEDQGASDDMIEVMSFFYRMFPSSTMEPLQLDASEWTPGLWVSQGEVEACPAPGQPIPNRPDFLISVSVSSLPVNGFDDTR